MTSHLTSTSSRWHTFSLMEQMGNIGSEVSRASHWQDKDTTLFWKSVERALELFDLTLDDPRWKGRRREIAIAREVFCDVINGGKLYRDSFPNLIRYFDEFAFAARNKM